LLYSVPNITKIDQVPHPVEYHHWRYALDTVDRHAYRQIHDELDTRFNGREVDTSSWVPGSNWTGTVFQPIYDACRQDEVAAGRFFGLLVWQVVMDREDCWSFGRYEKDGIPITGMTYFHIDCP
jgi:hypothetical protein